jgi:hypothetical protein
MREAVSFSYNQSVALHRAEERAVRRCMVRAGFTYQVVPPSANRRAAEVNPYGLLDPERAHADGYGMTVQHFEGSSTPPDPNAQTVAALPENIREKWEEALLGTPRHHKKVTLLDGRKLSYDENSCVQKARREVYGAEWNVLFQSFQGFSNRVMQETVESPRFEKALHAWTDCMRKAGYSFADLQAPREVVQAKLDTADGDRARLRAAGKTELRIARRDSACERKARLHEATRDAQATAEKHVLTGHEAEYRRLVELRRQALDRLPRQSGSVVPS